MNETTSDDEPIPDSALHLRFAMYRQIARCYVAFVVVFGMIGNVTCLIIYRRASLNRCRRVQYLTAVALSDLVFLFCLGLMWLKGVGIHWHEMPGICSASIYVSNTASCLSGWYVMVLTAEMACVLRRPYHIVRTTAGGRLNVAKRIACASLVGCLMNSWTLFVTESVPKLAPEPDQGPEYDYIDDNVTESNYTYVETIYETDPLLMTETITESISTPTPPPRAIVGYNCRIALESKVLYDAFTVIDMIASFSIPLVITLVLNLFIGWTITKAARQRRFMSQHQILARLRAKAQQTASDQSNGIIPNNFPQTTRGSLKLSATSNHQPLSKSNSGNSAGSGNNNRRRSALKRRESGHRVLSEVASRLRRIALKQRLRAESTVSSLLVAKSLTYLILNLPNYVHRIWLTLRPKEMQDQNASEQEFLLQMIVYLTFYTHYALNFVIYSSNAFVRNVCNHRSRSSSSMDVK